MENISTEHRKKHGKTLQWDSMELNWSYTYKNHNPKGLERYTLLPRLGIFLHLYQHKVSLFEVLLWFTKNPHQMQWSRIE